MTICHIITALGFGGAERLLVELTRIQREEHEVHVVYLKDDTAITRLMAPGILLHYVPLGAGCASAVRKLVKSLNPEVVHTHVGHADFIGQWAIRGLPVKRFCTMHNIRYKWNWKDNVIFFGYRVLFGTVAKSCKIIAISNVVADHINKTLGVDKSRIILIVNAIPEVDVKQTKAELRRELSIDNDAFVLLFVGRIEIPKSLETLLYAVDKVRTLPRLAVYIVGNGSRVPFLKELAASLNLGDIVKFPGGALFPEKYFSAADVFILPSEYEGFGLVVLEAFRSALPVITTNIQGPRELVRDGENGLLIEPRDHKTLAEQILKLHNSEKLRNEFGTAGYKTYKTKYSIDLYARKVMDVYTGRE